MLGIALSAALAAQGWATLDFTGASNDLPMWRGWLTITFLDEHRMVSSSAYYCNFYPAATDTAATSQFSLKLQADKWKVEKSADGKQLTVHGSPGRAVREVRYETYSYDPRAATWERAPALRAPTRKGSSPVTRVVINPRPL